MMKHTRCLLALLLSALFVTNITAEAQEHIRITNGEWPPFLSQDLPHFGAVSRIITDAFALEGVTVEHGFFPWKRSYKLAESGEWGATAVWVHSGERAQAFHFSESVLKSQNVFFYLKDFPIEWESLDDLADIKIGVSIGYYYGEEFEQAEQAGRLNVERSFDDEMNLRMLQKGRIQACIIDLYVGYALLRKNFPPKVLEQITHHSKAVTETSYHLLFSKKANNSTTQLSVFNKGLNKLKESGKFEQYLQEALEGKYDH
jgi:polar amino acid transport system substrate-binding protein